MPKTTTACPFVQIVVRLHSDDSLVGQIDLPTFCIDHMRMTPPEANLKTMNRHIQMRCPDLKIRDVYVSGQLRDGIQAEEVESGITLHVVPQN